MQIVPADEQQARALLEAVKGHRLEALYWVTLFLGLRIVINNSDGRSSADRQIHDYLHTQFALRVCLPSGPSRCPSHPL